MTEKAWKYESEWATPSDFLREQLFDLRGKPSTHIESILPTEQIGDHILGERYPLDLEIMYFLVGGEGYVGSRDYSFLNNNQFIQALLSVYPADEHQLIENLTKDDFAILRDRIEANNKFLEKKSEEGQEKAMIQTINSWCPDRIDFFMMISGRTIPNIGSENQLDTAKLLWNSIKANSGKVSFPEIDPTYELYMNIISPLFLLTPEEMRLISRNERSFGHIYLDSLVEASALLAPDYDLALRKYVDLKNTGYSEVGDMALDARRNEAINTIVLGGTSPTSVRTNADKLFKTGRQAGNHPEVTLS